MFRIDKTSYGYRLTLGGDLTVVETLRLKTELAAVIGGLRPPFGVIVDIRALMPIMPEAKVYLQECEQLAKDAGLQRRAVILQSPVVKAQVKQLSLLSKTDNIERRINASLTDDWEELALAWVVEGVEPSPALGTDSGYEQSSSY